MQIIKIIIEASEEEGNGLFDLKNESPLCILGFLYFIRDSPD